MSAQIGEVFGERCRLGHRLDELFGDHGEQLRLRAHLMPEAGATVLADRGHTRPPTDHQGDAHLHRYRQASEVHDYRDYTALSFTAQGLTVTVVSRHPLPPSP